MLEIVKHQTTVGVLEWYDCMIFACSKTDVYKRQIKSYLDRTFASYEQEYGINIKPTDSLGNRFDMIIKTAYKQSGLQVACLLYTSTGTSTWTSVDHLVSRLPPLTWRPVQARFHCGCAPVSYTHLAHCVLARNETSLDEVVSQLLELWTCQSLNHCLLYTSITVFPRNHELWIL